ncbi:transposase [Streptomyces sp. SAI-129]|uniref:transposase n=1 Tax=Streptomyces sp. SAI-129 TaxID=3377727 RepID=UPI003C7E4D36
MRCRSRSCARWYATSAAWRPGSFVWSGHALTDAQWAWTEPLLPDRTPKRGGRWRDLREVIDAIASRFQTGAQWVHLPQRCGNWRGVQPAADMGL